MNRPFKSGLLIAVGLTAVLALSSCSMLRQYLPGGHDQSAQSSQSNPDASSSHDELRVNAIDQAWVQTAIDVGRHEPAFPVSELIPHFLGDERKQVRFHNLLWRWDVQTVCVHSLLHLFSLSSSQAGRGGRLLAIITLLFLWRKYSIYSSQP